MDTIYSSFCQHFLHFSLQLFVFGIFWSTWTSWDILFNMLYFLFLFGANVIKACTLCNLVLPIDRICASPAYERVLFHFMLAISP
jgi:hypothetical protein